MASKCCSAALHTICRSASSFCHVAASRPAFSYLITLCRVSHPPRFLTSSNSSAFWRPVYWRPWMTGLIRHQIDPQLLAGLLKHLQGTARSRSPTPSPFSVPDSFSPGSALWTEAKLNRAGHTCNRLHQSQFSELEEGSWTMICRKLDKVEDSFWKVTIAYHSPAHCAPYCQRVSKPRARWAQLSPSLQSFSTTLEDGDPRTFRTWASCPSMQPSRSPRSDCLLHSETSCWTGRPTSDRPPSRRLCWPLLLLPSPGSLPTLNRSCLSPSLTHSPLPEDSGLGLACVIPDVTNFCSFSFFAMCAFSLRLSLPPIRMKYSRSLLNLPLPGNVLLCSSSGPWVPLLIRESRLSPSFPSTFPSRRDATSRVRLLLGVDLPVGGLWSTPSVNSLVLLLACGRCCCTAAACVRLNWRVRLLAHASVRGGHERKHDQNHQIGWDQSTTSTLLHQKDGMVRLKNLAPDGTHRIESETFLAKRKALIQRIIFKSL